MCKNQVILLMITDNEKLHLAVKKSSALFCKITSKHDEMYIANCLHSLLYKIDTCHKNPEKSSTTQINKHTASIYLLFTHCSFDNTKNYHDYYRGTDYVKTFSEEFKK